MTDSGASLILVLVFLIVGTILIAAIATEAANDLLNKNNFQRARSFSYDATSAIDTAVQSIRYTPLLSPSQTLNASPPRSCWPTPTTKTIEPTAIPKTPTSPSNEGATNFRVWCSTRWNPASANTRIVTLSACLSSVLPAACARRPAVQEVVTFDDYPTGVAAPTHAACHTYCGMGMTVDSWVEHPTMPTVTRLSCATSPGMCATSPLGGPITSTSNITITGTGFVQGSTVQFVEESNGVPSEDNVVYTVSPRTISSVSLTVTAPKVDEGSTYFVTVTTPAGSSAYTGASVFTYTVGLPNVTSVCTGPAGTGPTGTTCTGSSTIPEGPVSGGSEVTIWGTGFWCQLSCASETPTVQFISATTTSISATYVTIVSNTEITTTSPPEFKIKPSGSPARAAFDVKVKRSEVTSTQIVQFDYVPMVPTVTRVTYIASTGHLRITGTGFVTGDGPVLFVTDGSTGPTETWVTSSSCSISSSSCKIDSSTELTAEVPTLTCANGRTYFVAVQSPTGTSSYSPPQDGGTFGYVYENADPCVNTTISLSENHSTASYGSETSETFTGTVTGQTGDGYPKGMVYVRAGRTTLCSESLPTGSVDRASFTCSIPTGTKLATTSAPYKVKATYIPATPASSNSGYVYAPSHSTPATMLSVTAQQR